MYYNYELEEDEFFNPKNTNAWFFYDILEIHIFLKMENRSKKIMSYILKKRGLIMKKKIFYKKYIFEKKPLILRKIEVLLMMIFLNYQFIIIIIMKILIKIFLNL